MLDDATRGRIKSAIESHDVLLFMKGNPAQPQCGFSATVIQILNDIVPDYGTVDVLSDPEVRMGIKEFSTIPWRSPEPGWNFLLLAFSGAGLASVKWPTTCCLIGR